MLLLPIVLLAIGATIKSLLAGGAELVFPYVALGSLAKAALLELFRVFLLFFFAFLLFFYFLYVLIPRLRGVVQPRIN